MTMLKTAAMRASLATLYMGRQSPGELDGKLSRPVITASYRKNKHMLRERHQHQEEVKVREASQAPPRTHYFPGRPPREICRSQTLLAHQGDTHIEGGEVDRRTRTFPISQRAYLLSLVDGHEIGW